MNVVVHSKLISFGMRDTPTALWSALKSVVGEDATIVVPTYTLHLTPAEVYDRQRTPSHKVGILSEYVRQLPGAVRSRTPLHSHAGIGPKAAFLNETPASISLGPQSDFSHLHDSDFTLLLLGCTANEGCTFLHHMEATAEVPYREWLDLPRQVTNDEDEATPITVRYFARRNAGLRNDFSLAVNPLLQSGEMTQAAALFGNSYAVPLRLLARRTAALLLANPYALAAPGTLQ